MRPRRRGRDARLDAITAGMTVRQRVAAMLAVLLEGESDAQTVAAGVGQGLTPAGWIAFRHSCDRVDQLRATTHDCLARVDLGIACLYSLAYQRTTESLAAAMADQLEFLLDWRYGSRGPERALDPYFDREVRAITDELRGMAGTMDTGGEGDLPVPPPEELLRDGILAAHHLLRALAIEAAAFAADLGADPLPPDLHALAARRRTALTACIEAIGLDPPIALTEPSGADVDAIAARCRPEEEAEGIAARG